MGIDHHGDDVQLRPKPGAELGTSVVELCSDTGAENLAEMLLSVGRELTDHVICNPVLILAPLFLAGRGNAVNGKVDAVGSIMDCEPQFDGTVGFPFN